MRRLLRILANAATALSTFLLLASAILWVRSYFIGNLLRHMGPDVIPNTSYFINSSIGRLSVSIYHQTSRDPTIGGGRYPAGFSFEEWDSQVNPLSWPSGATTSTLGFATAHARRAEGDDYTLVVPWYAITLALLAPPVIWFIRRRRRAKAAAGLRCAGCGYDMRATPERCPECGRVALSPNPNAESRNSNQ